MVTVEICIGSACFVKGSNHVVEDMKALIAEEKWEDSVTLKGCFCMKACQEKIGLGIRVNGVTIPNVSMQNAKEVLKEEITKALA